MLGKDLTVTRAALTAVILTIMAFIALVNTQAQDINSLKMGVVRIENNRSGDVGTGFIVKVDGNQVFIITASHVVKGDQHPLVYLFNQPYDALRAELLNREDDDTKGLALLRLTINSATAAGITALTLSYTTQISGGEYIKVIGFPEGTAFWTVGTGSVARIEGRDLVFSGVVRSGNSGGPVILNGLVIGIVTDVSQSFAYAARGEVIEPYVEGITRDLISPGKPVGSLPDNTRGSTTSFGDSSDFVRQHHYDFLNREPDASSMQFWTNNIESCGADAQCREVKRVNTSAAFFLSIEFQETGYLVYRVYKVAYGDATSPRVPGTVPVVRFQEFLPDARRIGQGVTVGKGAWEQQLKANKNAYMAEFVQRPRFLAAFPLSMTPAQFVDRLNQNAGYILTRPERDQLVAQLTSGGDVIAGRAGVLRSVAENNALHRNEFSRAFVLMLYFGYLRRNPDDPPDTDFHSWRVWLDKLNQFNGDFTKAGMIEAFINSNEYRRRYSH
jgi:hypothetical protein